MSPTSATTRSRRSIASILAALLLLLGVPAVTTVVTAGPAMAATTDDAVTWAHDRLGQHIYDGLCQSFVHDAYKLGANVEIGTGFGSAIGYWNAHANLHQPGTTPPKGALVFWDATATNPDGHVALSEGGGVVISSYERSNHNVHEFNIVDRNNAGYSYLGWMMPPGVSAPVGSTTPLISLRMSVIPITGDWYAGGGEDFAYVTKRADNGFDLSIWQNTDTDFVNKGVKWSVDGTSGVRFDNTLFIPADVDGDGLLDLYYATSTNWGANGFTVGLMHNYGDGLEYVGTKWSVGDIPLGNVRFLSGDWADSGRQGFAYVVKNGDGGFSVAAFDTDATNLGQLNWIGLKWTQAGNSGVLFDNTIFTPADVDGDGDKDMLYTTATNWDNAGFTMAEMRNDGASSAFAWDGIKWSQSALKLSDTRIIPGYWSGGSREGFAYVNKRADTGGFDFSVFQSQTSGMVWQGNWIQEPGLLYTSTAFVPTDANNDGFTDLYYATPGNHGFNMARFLNQGTAGAGFTWAGQQWNPTNIALNTTAFIPGF